MYGRNEELLNSLKVTQKIIHEYTALNEEKTRIEKSYQKLDGKYQKLWKGMTPFGPKAFLFALFLLIQYYIVYPLSYKYFALFVVTRTFLDKKVYFPFFIVFAIAISYALVMLIQFSHNKSAYRSNDKRAHKNMDIVMKNSQLATREEQVVDRLNYVKGLYSEKCSSWYPSDYTRKSQIDYLVSVVGTGEAQNISTAVTMLKEKQRIDEQVRMQKEYLNEQKRHNQAQEHIQIYEATSHMISNMAIASAIKNQSSTTYHYYYN